MRIKMKRFWGILLSLVMVLGLVPGMGMMTYAAGERAYTDYDVTTDANKTKDGDALTTLQVSFNGKKWYIIEDNSTAVNAGTVTLLAAESFGDSKFHDDSNKYSTSTIKTTLDNMTVSDGSFADVASAIDTVTVKGSDTDTEVDAKLYLLNSTEAKKVPEKVRKFSTNWWLRSAGYHDVEAAYVESVGVAVHDYGSDVKNTLGVRPALKLNLSKVTFDSENNTFSVKSSQDENTTFNPASTYTGFGDLNTNDSEVTISEVSGITWYVITNDSSTVTLLSKQSFGSQQFNSDTAMGNDYETSEIKTYVDGLKGEGKPLAGISSVISDLTLIDTATAQELSETKKKGEGNGWWLRSQGNYSNHAVFVDGGSGNVYVSGCIVEDTLGVRPALKLDLTKVTFDSATNTFALLPTPYPIWVGGVQVTSANKNDVLGDVDQGATVSFTPAVDDDEATPDVDESRPATLALNSAIINGGNSDGVAIYADGIDLTINVTGDSTVTGPVIDSAVSSTGIYINNGSLNITGSGTLTAMGGKHEAQSIGVYVDEEVTINGALNAIGDESSNGASYGIYAIGGITVNSAGTLTATSGEAHSGSYGIYTTNVTINGGEVYAIGGTGNGTSGLAVLNKPTAGTGKVLVSKGSETEVLDWSNVEAVYDNQRYGYFTVDTVATPMFNPAAGTYSSAQTVSISTTTAGATIRYTTDGTEPTEASTEYHDAITVKKTTTIKAKAFKDEASSDVASATYTIKTTQETTTKPTDTTPKDESSTVYRLYYGPTMEHFYTTSAYERRVLIDKYGWVDEGIAWKSPKAPTTDEEKKTIKPVYRLFNPFTTDHHYTKDPNERRTLIDKYGWKDEGIAFYSNDKGDATVYRLWHPGLITGAHHFTTGKHEYDVLITRGWIGETEAFKVNAAS